MELIKKNIHMNRLKASTVTQITMEDDFNVPDVKADIDEIITDSGKLIVDSIRVNNQKVNIKGKLAFALLYCSFNDGRMLHNMTGEIIIDEMINLEGVSDSDSISVKCDIEDLTVGVINSRKISVKAIVGIRVCAEDIYDIEPVVDIVNEDKCDCLRKEYDVSQLAIFKKDIFRIKDDVDIPANKPNMAEMLWNNMDVRNISFRLLEGKIDVAGELQMFVLYEAEEDNAPVQWLDFVVPFSGMIDMPQCSDRMIGDIAYNVSNSTVNIKPDYDGEQRVLELEMVLDLNIKIFDEERISVVSDVNSLSCCMEPEYMDAKINSLLMKNISKCKVADKIKLDSSRGHVMQLCASNGRVKLDTVMPSDNKIDVEGVVDVDIMYISSDDRMPICMAKEIVPFSQTVEAMGVNENSVVTIRPSLEQLNSNMAGNNEIEIKGYVSLDCLVFDTFDAGIIGNITKCEFDKEIVQKAPCIVGYKVKNGDTLWKIAKRYYTSVETLKILNELRGDEIKEGEMLLVVKEVL